MELFGSPVRWEWDMQRARRWVADFSVEGLDYEWIAELTAVGWGISFQTRPDDQPTEDPLSWGSYGITGTGNAPRVFGTALAILDDFVEKVSPATVSFTAQEPSRRSLYAKMVQRFARKKGYEVRHVRGGHFVLDRVLQPAMAGAA